MQRSHHEGHTFTKQSQVQSKSSKYKNSIINSPIKPMRAGNKSQHERDKKRDNNHVSQL